jgi:hypothetical protein
MDAQIVRPSRARDGAPRRPNGAGGERRAFPDAHGSYIASAKSRESGGMRIAVSSGMQDIKFISLRGQFIIASVLAATAAGCVDDASSEELDETDDAAISAAIDELAADQAQASKKLFIDPLVRQDGPLGQWLYDQLGKSWVRWATKTAWSEHPIADETGEFCGVNQSGPVWYLAGSFGVPVTRDCDVPFGKALFFPLLNTWIAAATDYWGMSTDEAWWTAYATEAMAEQLADTCDLTLRFDGHEILSGTAERKARLWTEVLDPFTIFVHETDNIYDHYPGGTWPLAYNGGHYALFLPPLPGDHVLELGGRKCDADGNTTFGLLATYNLHIH